MVVGAVFGPRVHLEPPLTSEHISYEFTWARPEPPPATIELRQAVLEFIKASDLRAGDRLPRESALAKHFGVPRARVREALALLEQDGVIDVHHARGRFVAVTSGLVMSQRIRRFESVQDMLIALGYRPTGKVVSLTVEEATDDEAAALGLATREKVVRLRRLRLHETRALACSEDIFPASLLGESRIEEREFGGTLAAVFAAHGIELVSSDAYVEAAFCPTPFADLPEVDNTRPWLLMTERCVDQHGTRVLYTMNYHYAALFSFRLLRRPWAGALTVRRVPSPGPKSTMP
jgi:GntR family transcriptional regulator